LRPNNDEPQSPQNHFSPPPSGFHTRSLSSWRRSKCVGCGVGVRQRCCSAATLAAVAVALARDHERPGHPDPDGPAVAAAGEREVGHRQRYLLISGRDPNADAGTASFCSIAALCSAPCSPATSEALRRGHGDAGRLGVTTVLSICVQVARVSGALRDRRASSSAGMTSAASSRIERNTWA
jgi:hypothetical protein